MAHLRHSIIFLMILSLLSGVYSCEKMEAPEPNDSHTEQNEADNNEFVILFTNDLHSQIEPTSKNLEINADRGGAKRLKALVDSVRRAEPHVLLADSGDLVQGTYYFTLLNGVVEMMILDELGYDIRTVDRKSTV